MTETEVQHSLESAKCAGIQYVVLTGGEPFIQPELLFSAVLQAHELDMPVTIRTNAFWCETQALTDRAVYFLKSIGVERIGLSLDTFHLRFIPVENVRRLLKACVKYEVSHWLDWVSVSSDTWQSIAKLVGFQHVAVVEKSDVCPTGRARLLPAEDFGKVCLDSLEFDDKRSFTCNSFEYVEVYPGGYVELNSRCCDARHFMTRVNGDIHWVSNLIREAEASPARQFLMQYGIGGIVRQARKQCPELLQDEYRNDCDICRFLLPHLFPAECLGKNAPGWLFKDDGYSLSRHKGKLMNERIARRIDGMFVDWHK